MPAKVGEFRRGRVEGNRGREVGGSLKLCSSSWPAGGRDCQPWKNSPPVVPVQPGWRRQRERARPMCSSAPHAAQLHIESPWRGLCRTISGSDGRGTLLFLATLINLLRIAPSEGIRLDSPWRKPRPFKNAGLLFFILPNFLELG